MRTHLKNSVMCNLAVLFAAAALAEAGSVSDLWAESLKAETAGDYRQALKVHQQLLPMVGTAYAANLRAGWLYYLNQDFDHALMCYEQAAGLSTGALAPLFGAMNCHLAAHRTEQGIKVAKAILVIDDLNYTANKQLAVLSYEAKNFSLAAAYYHKLNRLYPEDPAVASGLAWSYLEQGAFRKAVPLFKEILMISPDYAYAQRGLEVASRSANQQGTEP